MGGDFELSDPTVNNNSIAPGRRKHHYNKTGALSIAQQLAHIHKK